MVTSSMHMLKLPPVLIRTDLPHWTFLTIKGMTAQKTNGFFLHNKLDGNSVGWHLGASVQDLVDSSTRFQHAIGRGNCRKVCPLGEPPSLDLSKCGCAIWSSESPYALVSTMANRVCKTAVTTHAPGWPAISGEMMMVANSRKCSQTI